MERMEQYQKVKREFSASEEQGGSGHQPLLREESLPVLRRGQTDKLLLAAEEEVTNANAFLKVDVAPCLDLGRVISNGNHILRTFKISNRSTFEVEVQLSSDRPEEVAFQLNNENLKYYSDPLMNGAGAENDFNQLFNTIDLKEKIRIPGLSEQQVILTYLPSTKVPSAEDGGGSAHRVAPSAGRNEASSAPIQGRQQSTSTVKGGLFFQATVVEDQVPEAQRPFLRPEERACQRTVRFVAQLCKSILAVSQSEIMFSGCVSGGTYYRDFSLQNQSEIPLHFSLSMSPSLMEAVSNGVISFSEYEVEQEAGEATEGFIKSGKVPALSRARIRVTFSPNAVGEFQFEARFENKNDQSNCEVIRMLAIVSDEGNEEGLEVSVRPWYPPGSSHTVEDAPQKMRGRDAVLDFANCFTGIGQRKIMLIKNVTQAKLNVFFSTDGQNDVRFDLHTDLQDSDDEEDEARNDLDSSMSGEPSPLRPRMLEHTQSVDSSSGIIPAEGQNGTHLNDTASNPGSSRDLRSDINDEGLLKRSAESDTSQAVERGTDTTTKPARKPRNVHLTDDVEARHGRIEELDLMPGQERAVVVWYCPSVRGASAAGEGQRVPGTSYDKSLASLTSRSFHVVLKAMYHSDPGLERLESVHTPVAQSMTLHSRRVILGKARVCTSFIDVPEEVNLGDCTIGSSKKGELRIRNLSEMPCTISLKFTSKILKVLEIKSPESSITINPLDSYAVTFEIIPMRINPGYCKQVTIVNLTNRANDQFVNLRANNVDSNRVSLHALFYLVRTKHPSNTIFFDTLVTNSPMFRTLTLKNITQSNIVLELTPSLDGILLFQENDSEPWTSQDSTSSQADTGPRRVVRNLNQDPKGNSAAIKPLAMDANLKASLVEQDESGANVVTGSFRQRSRSLEAVRDIPMDDVFFRPPQVDQPAAPNLQRSTPPTMKQKRESRTSKSRFQKAKTLWQSLKSRYETSSFFGVATRYFNTVEDELSFIQSFLLLKQDLDKVIKEKVLTPISRVTLPPQNVVSLVAVINAPNSVVDEASAGKIRNLESHINITMLEYEQELLEKAMYHRGRLVTYTKEDSQTGSKIPVRSLPINTKVCRSVMEVAQRHINFGTVLANDDCTKKLIIKNLSDVPLMYQIVKPKNWVSDEFMNFGGDDSMGVIKPHGQHERDFIFTPKISGKFCEVLQIVNLQDPENVVKVIVKALVRKRETFVLQPSSLDFGRCFSMERSRTYRIELTNLTKSSRSVVVRHAFMHFAFSFEGQNIDKELPDSALSVQYVLEKCMVVHEKVNKEEEIEKMERKLRIYVRKGKTAKAAMMKEKIAAMKAPLMPDVSGGSSGDKDSTGERSGAPSPEGSDHEYSLYPSESEYSSDDQSDAEDADWNRRQARSEAAAKHGQCVVHLPGKGVQTILVSMLVPSVLNHLLDVPDSALLEGVVRGKLIAHEQANRDAHKAIEFTFHLEGAGLGTTRNLSEGLKMSAARMIEGRDNDGQAEAPGRMAGGQTILREYKVKPSPGESTATIDVLDKKVELNDVHIGESIEGSIVVVNKGSEAASFIVMNPSAGKKKEDEGKQRVAAGPKTDIFKFSMQQVKLESAAQQKITFTCVPELAGRQQHTIIVRDIKAAVDCTVSVSFTGRKKGKESSSYVKFPDGEEALDFGDCYIAPTTTMLKQKYIKKVPMRIESVHQETVLLTIRSNLTNQILIFSDEELESPAENIELQPLSQVTVYVCILAPIEGKKDARFQNVSFGSTTLWDEYNKGVSRELVVGVTVDVLDFKSKESIVQQGLQMKGRIGKSIMRLSSKAIDLGVSSSLGEMKTASFSLSNHSDWLPLRYAIMPPPGVQVSSTGGELEGRKKGEGSSTVTVELTFRPKEFGLFCQPLMIANLSANQFWSQHEEKREIIVYHFADEGVIASGGEEQDAHVEIITTEGVPCTHLHLVNNYAIPEYINYICDPSGEQDFINSAAQSEASTDVSAPIGKFLETPALPAPSEGFRKRAASPVRARSPEGRGLPVKPFTKVHEKPIISEDGVVSPRHSPISRTLRSPDAMPESYRPSSPARPNPHARQMSPPRASPPRFDRPESSSSTGVSKPDTVSVVAGDIRIDSRPSSPTVQDARMKQWRKCVRRQGRALNVVTLTLKNQSSEEMHLRPMSSLNLLVQAEIAPDVSKTLVEKLMLQDSMEPNTEAKADKVPLESGKLSPRRRSGVLSKQVGPVFTIAAGQAISVFVALLPTQALSADGKERLLSGTKVAFDGPLLFEALSSPIHVFTQTSNDTLSKIVHRIMVDGWWTVSIASADEVLSDLGKVGHVNQWKPIDFQVMIRNRSEIPLLLKAAVKGATSANEIVLERSEGNGVPGDGLDSQSEEDEESILLCVEPLSEGYVQGKLIPSPSLTDAEEVGNDGRRTWHLCVQNLRNPGNEIDFHIAAHVITSTLLKFSGRQLTEEAGHDNERGFKLRVPEIVLPNLPDAKCNELFTVTNQSDEPVELHAYVELEDQIEDLITVDILSSSTSTHVHSFSLNPAQSMQIVAVCKGKDGVVEVPPGMAASKSISLGKIVFQFSGSAFRAEQVQIEGSFQQGRPLSVDQETMKLKWDATEGFTSGPHDSLWKSATFEVQNMCKTAVPFKIRAAIPPQLRESDVAVEPLDGEIPAFGRVQVLMSVHAPLDHIGRVQSCDDPVELFVDDPRLLRNDEEANRATQKISVDLVVDTAADHPPHWKQEMQMSQTDSKQTTAFPSIILRGCTLLGDTDGSPAFDVGLPRYEVNVGQVSYEEGEVEWNLTLENDHDGGSVGYAVTSTTKDDDTWLKIKDGKGVLDKKGISRHVSLLLDTSTIGVFSSYLWVHNLSNPFDTKVVRVSMEVVGTHKSGPQGMFGEATTWFTVQAEDFPRVVESDLPEESRAPHVSMGHICYGQLYRNRSFIIRNESMISLEFSLSSNIESSSRTELSFSSTHDVMKNVRSVTLRPTSWQKIWVYYRPAPTGVSASPDVKQDGDKVDFEVYVRCRLVKDHQKVIKFTAVCSYPTLSLRRETNVVFSTNQIFEYSRSEVGTLAFGKPGSLTPGGITPAALTPKSATPSDFSTTSSLSSYCGSQDESTQKPGLPNLSIPSSEIVLSPKHFDPPCFLVPLSNNANEDAHIALCNDTFYFEGFVYDNDVPAKDFSQVSPIPWHEVPAPEAACCAGTEDLAPSSRAAPMVWIVPPRSTRFLLIRLKPKAIQSKQSTIIKHRYVQEFLFLYNRKDLSEMYTLSLAFSVGFVSEFFVPPGSKSGHTYSSLEGSVLSFLSQYNRLWQTMFSSELAVEDSTIRRAPSISNSDISGLSDTYGLGSSWGFKGSTMGGVLQSEAAARKEILAAMEQAATAAQTVCEAMGARAEFHRLAFMMHCIIDSMVNYGVREDRGAVFQLTSLLFSALFRHDSFVPFMLIAAEHRRAQKKRSKQPKMAKSMNVGTSGKASDMEDNPIDSESADIRDTVMVYLPKPMVMMLQQLSYLLSFFPGRNEAIPEIRKAEHDLWRIVRPSLFPRDSQLYSEFFAPMSAEPSL